ncbi:serine protease Do [Devosia enhydra]|uniref:Probable periplasmic serine endoprotease DegP-like n=1 Tax=Devosia enhydra TaxID=665118 RepID=A0A1K2I0Q6_9HYPH|nr:Do family serine endopeptidase [Devosia enhydra]SFZ85855.1 serine protease Do [Devosia enhydra]
MRSSFASRARRWIGASTLAMVVGFGGGAAFMAATSPMAIAQGQPAQVQPVAQIVAPEAAMPTGFADLVEAVKPAVVSIIVESEARGPRSTGRGAEGFNFNFPDLPDDHPFRDFFDQFRSGPGDRGGDNRATPRQPRRVMATGSGFAISADGYIVTNNHVVEDATKVTVRFDNGDETEATVVGTDERTDLAVIKIEGFDDLPFVTFAQDDARVGDWVLAVGNPFGLGGTVTSGIVSARGRDIAGSTYGDFLQIDAAVNTGNSGGPAFNLKGEVVGVNTAIFSPNGGNVGIAFAIPANTVQQIANQLIQDGSVTRGFLGVSIQDVTRDIADSLGLANTRGALVAQPSEGGPAERAGVQSGDVVLSVDGARIDNALALSRTIAAKAPGSTVELVVWRDGAEQTISVKLDTLTEEEAAAPAQEEEVTPEEPAGPVTSSVGITLVPDADSSGLLIQDIEQGTIASEKGFAVGDVIVEVDNKAVSTPEAFEDAIAGVRDSGRATALVKTLRNGATRFIGLPLDRD